MWDWIGSAESGPDECVAEQIKRRQKLLSGKMTDRVASLGKQDKTGRICLWCVYGSVAYFLLAFLPKLMTEPESHCSQRRLSS